MIIILDTASGMAYNFKYRKDAGLFMGVSQPTLRAMLKQPFYLFKTLIITHTHNDKIIKSNRELVKRHIKKIGEREKKRNGNSGPIQTTNKNLLPVQGGINKDLADRLNGTRSNGKAKMDRAG